jgi:hypothetical protein
VPGATLANVNPDWYVPAFKAYSKAPVGAVIVIVPVCTPQVGCVVTEAVGAAGAPSAALSVIDVPDVIQALFVVDLTEMGYVPADKFVKDVPA